MNKSYNEFQLEAMKFINNMVIHNLNKFHSEHNWTKEQLLNIFMFFSIQKGYNVRYNYLLNAIELFNEDSKREIEFSTYDEFIDWFNDERYGA